MGAFSLVHQLMNIERGDPVVLKSDGRHYIVTSDLYNTSYLDVNAVAQITERGTGFQRTVPVTELKYDTAVA